MAIGANSYGTTAGVAALTSRYADATTKLYTTATRPTLAQVESWIDQTSATLNVGLAKEGFAIPVTNTDAKAALAAIVEAAVVDLCHAANSAGRFFTQQALDRGISPLVTIRREMMDWVSTQADGLELLGAERTRPATAGILYRDSDESGDEIFPIFQRKGFHNQFTDWDSD